MRLILLHGRTDPEERMNHFGFDGPKLKKLIAIHTVYNEEHTVYFETPEAAVEAQFKTGWRRVDDHALQIELWGDMIRTDEPNKGTRFYGDWEVQV